jgi:Methyl-accepting chemotaxis protein (MCP) signalling domain
VGGGAASLVDSAAAAVTSLQIGKVTGMIRSISMKTNLLAPNAAVEAAHAGQFGAGFGVVAEEVKTMSQAAAECTAKIDSRIAAMSHHVGNVTAAMDGVASIKRIRGIQDTIAAAVKEQTATTEQIAASNCETAQGCRGDSSPLESTPCACSSPDWRKILNRSARRVGTSPNRGEQLIMRLLSPLVEKTYWGTVFPSKPNSMRLAA